MEASTANGRRRGSMHWEDSGAYALVFAGIYLLVGVLFFYAGKEKIIDGHGAPPPIEKQLAGTFVDTIPGIDAAWTILGILESLIFILIVVSLVRLEFMPDRRKTFLVCAAKPRRRRALPLRRRRGPGGGRDWPERQMDRPPGPIVGCASPVQCLTKGCLVRLKLLLGAVALVALLAFAAVASANYQLRFGPAKRAISQETARVCSQVDGCKSWSVHPCRRQSYHRIDCLSNYFFTDGAVCSSVTTATYRRYAEGIVINHKRIRC